MRKCRNELPERGEGGDARRHESGLGVAREDQILVGTREAKLGERLSERAIRFIEYLRRGREASREVLAHADELRALSRKAPSDAHDHILTSALPQEIPAPSAHMRTVCPGLILPSRTAASCAMGIDALEVLP